MEADLKRNKILGSEADQLGRVLEISSVKLFRRIYFKGNIVHCLVFTFGRILLILSWSSTHCVGFFDYDDLALHYLIGRGSLQNFLPQAFLPTILGSIYDDMLSLHNMQKLDSPTVIIQKQVPKLSPDVSVWPLGSATPKLSRILAPKWTRSPQG